MNEAIVSDAVVFSHLHISTHYQPVSQEGNGTSSRSDLMFTTQRQPNALPRQG